MQIVIDIDEADYKLIQHEVAVDNLLCPLSEREVMTKIANGIPLPKGHGKLYDENVVKKEAIRREWTSVMYYTLDHMLSYMKPAIEADKEVSHE